MIVGRVFFFYKYIFYLYNYFGMQCQNLIIMQCKITRIYGGPLLLGAYCLADHRGGVVLLSFYACHLCVSLIVAILNFR